MKRIGAILIAITASILAGSALGAGTVTLKIGASPGAVHDSVGRLVSRHLGKFLPGNPDIIVENIGGGGGVMLARQMESSEPADGSVIGLTNAGIITTSIVTPDKAPFHADKVNWIGSMGLLPSICAVTNKSGITSIADLVSRDDVKLGASGNGTKLYVLPAIIKHLLGAKFQVVQGFEGMAEVRLAMERGEIDGVCGLTLTTFASTGFADFSKPIGTFDAGVEYNGAPIPLISAPEASDIDRQAAALLVKDEQVFAPFLVPGATDPATVAAIRAAFTAMVADPEFQADAAKVVPNAVPTTGEQVEALVRELTASDPAIIARAKQLAE